jgi:hypothetical protein
MIEFVATVDDFLFSFALGMASGVVISCSLMVAVFFIVKRQP